MTEEKRWPVSPDVLHFGRRSVLWALNALVCACCVWVLYLSYCFCLRLLLRSSDICSRTDLLIRKESTVTSVHTVMSLVVTSVWSADVYADFQPRFSLFSKCLTTTRKFRLCCLGVCPSLLNWLSSNCLAWSDTELRRNTWTVQELFLPNLSPSCLRHIRFTIAMKTS